MGGAQYAALHADAAGGWRAWEFLGPFPALSPHARWTLFILRRVGWLLIGLGVALLVWLALSDGPQAQTRPPEGGAAQAKARVSAPGRWERQVLGLMRGDDARFERTVQAKRVKFPHLSREELMEVIHAEYVRDQR